MPIISYFVTVSAALLGLLYVAADSLGPARPIALNTSYHSVTKPEVPRDPVQILTVRDAPAPDMSTANLPPIIQASELPSSAQLASVQAPSPARKTGSKNAAKTLKNSAASKPKLATTARKQEPRTRYVRYTMEKDPGAVY